MLGALGLASRLASSLPAGTTESGMRMAHSGASDDIYRRQGTTHRHTGLLGNQPHGYWCTYGPPCGMGPALAAQQTTTDRTTRMVMACTCPPKDADGE